MISDANYHKLSEEFMAAVIAVHQKFFRKAVMPIPVSHFLLLQVLSNEGPMTIRDLGEILQLSKQQMTPLLDRLEKSEVISRQPRENDRRFIIVSLTEKGQSIVDAFNEKLRQRVEKGLRTLSDNDFNKIADSTVIFSQCIKQMDTDFHSNK